MKHPLLYNANHTACCVMIAQLPNKNANAQLPNKVTFRKRLRYTVRPKVFKRDNYQCRICLSPFDLTLHHIYPFTKYFYRGKFNLIKSPEFLVTVCRACHDKIPNTVESPENYFDWERKQKRLCKNKRFP